MRFAILHCRNVACGHRLWVPVAKLGNRVRCPECGVSMPTPADVPPDQFVLGPDIPREPSAAEEAEPAGHA